MIVGVLGWGLLGWIRCWWWPRTVSELGFVALMGWVWMVRFVWSLCWWGTGWVCVWIMAVAQGWVGRGRCMVSLMFSL